MCCIALQPRTTIASSPLGALVQAKFVDDPAGAVSKADRLVQELMVALGYPVADLDQRGEDISVDYPFLVRNYIAARQIAMRERSGQSSTEDLRQALVPSIDTSVP